MAGFGQIEAPVTKPGMVGEFTSASSPTPPIAGLAGAQTGLFQAVMERMQALRLRACTRVPGRGH